MKSISIPLLRSRSHAPSGGEARAAREACGWTQEQMADALGVLPAEVAVWESGAVAMPAEMQRWMQYETGHALHLRRLREAGAPECGWLDANRAGQAAIVAEGGMVAWNRAWVHHQRACPECRRARGVARTLPPPPDPPLPWPQPFFRRVRRLPWRLRIPALVAISAVIAAAGLLFGVVYGWLRGRTDGSGFSVTTLLAVTAAITAWNVVDDLLGTWSDTHPVASAWVMTAGVEAAVGAVLLVRLGGRIDDPFVWQMYAMAVIGTGWILSRGAAERVADLTAKPTRS